MTAGKLDRRSVLMLVAGVAVILALRFGVYNGSTAETVPAADSIPLAEKRLEKLRQIAATVPGKETVLKQVAGELAEREKGILKADTAPQAQAQLLETVRRVGKANGIETRGAEDMRVVAMGSDYGEVLVTVSFGCGIEQLVNFLAALANEPGVLATNELHVSGNNNKQKTIQVRLRVSAVVPKKLVPEKKGVATF